MKQPVETVNRHLKNFANRSFTDEVQVNVKRDLGDTITEFLLETLRNMLRYDLSGQRSRVITA